MDKDEEDLLMENVCPDCEGELDTGWECNDCGRDWFEERLLLPPDPDAI